ncbi:transposase family protein [Clostridioides sp. ZZV15-6597]|uniref:transposase family protein n=1 Tax=Clostridioides sp. ZZV15-6597 TaxID=2811500 RepID=UPI001D1201B3|nr:transposase family protein [Clostridioides sp. ZZV15-6597]
MDELNLSEFTIIDKIETLDKIIFYVIPKYYPYSCPICGGALTKHAKIERRARDINILNKNVMIIIKAFRFRCLECNNVFTQQFNSIHYRDKVTIRLITYIKLKALEIQKKQNAELSKELNLSTATIKNIRKL